MSVDALLTAGVVLAVLVALVRDLAPPAVAMLAGVTVLLVGGVIDASQAFAGFSNPAPITVGALFVVARAVEVTGAADRLTRRALARTPPAGRRGERRELARLLTPSAALSALFNNTPIVALLAPRVSSWARQTGRSSSRYLLPLSYATILGGLITLIGTSTNLVVSGLLAQQGMAPIGLFEPARVGLPLAAGGLLLLVAVSPRLLPTRRTPSDDVAGDARDYTIEVVVEPLGELVGKTVADAGLRALQGVYLVELERDGVTISPVGPDERLQGDDHLVFAGNVERVVDLQRIAGLRSAEQRHFSLLNERPDGRLFEAVIAEGSQLVGRTLEEIGFRAEYDAAVIAIHRAGERAPGKLGAVRLRAGDVLVVLARRGFRRRWRGARDFLLVAPVDGSGAPRSSRAWVVQLLMVGLLVTAGTGMLDILVASLLAAVGLVLFGVLSADEARDAVDLDVLVLIAASFGLGAAVQASGLATTVADAITAVLGDAGGVGLLAGVLVATMALTGLVSNNAAAVLMFPIALAVAVGAGLEPRPFVIAVMVGASTDFLTPIGYQTNTMVYGMGGYRFSDFARLGFPLTILTVVVAITVIPRVWPLT